MPPKPLKLRPSEFSRAEKEIWGEEQRLNQKEAMSCNLSEHQHVPTQGGGQICIDCAREIERRRKRKKDPEKGGGLTGE